MTEYREPIAPPVDTMRPNTPDEGLVASPLLSSQASIRFGKERMAKEIDNYFVGPRDLDRHSKWPIFFRMHGSILPKMLLPLTFVAIWSSIITCLSKLMYELSVSNVLLVILGFLVGMALSFRSSTAYERYSDGRKFWTQLMYNSNVLARIIWVHTDKRTVEEKKEEAEEDKDDGDKKEEEKTCCCCCQKKCEGKDDDKAGDEKREDDEKKSDEKKDSEGDKKGDEDEDEEEKGDEKLEELLDRISALNLILAFAVALKHKLRFQPYTCYDDLHGLIGHLDTFARAAEHPGTMVSLPKPSKWKSLGQYLGLSFAESNPRKVIKQSSRPLGNLPLEIHTHLSAYMDKLMNEDKLVLRYQGATMNALNGMIEVLAGTDRVLNTPLPIAYSIAISQITWVYVLLLPFQLYRLLGWVTIPGTIFAAYVILGISLIGSQIENPFGNDVNDLPLDNYCAQIASELDIMAATPPPEPGSIKKGTEESTETKDGKKKKKRNVRGFNRREENKLLYPLSHSGYDTWAERGEERIRDALRVKAKLYTPDPVGLNNGFFTSAASSSGVDLGASAVGPTPFDPTNYWRMRRNSDGSSVRSERTLVQKKYAGV